MLSAADVDALGRAVVMDGDGRAIGFDHHAVETIVARHVTAALNEAAVRAVHHDDESPDDERAALYMAVRFAGDTDRAEDWAAAFDAVYAVRAAANP